MTIHIGIMAMTFINKIQQEKASSIFHSNDVVVVSNHGVDIDADNDDDDDNDMQAKSTLFSTEPFKPLPSILIDFFALTICDFLPMKPIKERTAPELMYFIQKITFHARISCHIAVVALIYIDRCKAALPKHAIGDQDTAHRIFIASLLVASKYLHGTKWGQQRNENKPNWLTNQRMKKLCDNMYTLQQINQLERSFLRLIQYKCWVDDTQVQDYLLQHRQDLLL